MKRYICYVKVSMRYWSSMNWMSRRQNQSPIGKIHFPTKLVTIKSFTPHEERHTPPLQEPQSMCTRNAKQNTAQHQEGANSCGLPSRAKTMTDMETHHIKISKTEGKYIIRYKHIKYKHTTSKYKKVKI